MPERQERVGEVGAIEDDGVEEGNDGKVEEAKAKQHRSKKAATRRFEKLAISHHRVALSAKNSLEPLWLLVRAVGVIFSIRFSCMAAAK